MAVSICLMKPVEYVIFRERKKSSEQNVSDISEMNFWGHNGSVVAMGNDLITNNNKYFDIETSQKLPEKYQVLKDFETGNVNQGKHVVSGYALTLVTGHV